MVSQFEKLEDYDAEIPEHIRSYLLNKKISLQVNYINQNYKDKDLKILDLGCGTGWHIKKMQEHGYELYGIDSSSKQCERAIINSGSKNIKKASILDIPCANNYYDVVYTINTLHHLPTRAMQRDSLIEISRVLKPGGLLVVHEINVLNPIIKIYMDYVFPRLRGIDDGSELWLNPGLINKLSDSFDLVYTKYYTFIPDFLPRILLKPAIHIERFFENSYFNCCSAHFMSVFKNK